MLKREQDAKVKDDAAKEREQIILEELRIAQSTTRERESVIEQLKSEISASQSRFESIQTRLEEKFKRKAAEADDYKRNIEIVELSRSVRDKELETMRNLLEESQADYRELASNLEQQKSRLMKEENKQDKMVTDQKALRETLREGKRHVCVILGTCFISRPYTCS